MWTCQRQIDHTLVLRYSPGICGGFLWSLLDHSSFGYEVKEFLNRNMYRPQFDGPVIKSAYPVMLPG